MNAKLSDDDRRAVDLLLDARFASPTAGGNGAHAGVFAGASSNFSDRVRSVEQLLQLLDAQPSGDPPQGLSLRTLRRIEELVAAEQAGLPAHQAFSSGPRPVYEG